MTGRIEGVRACMFDAYGTLFDIHSPVARVAGRLGPQADSLSRLWRQKQLEYTWLRSLMPANADFRQVTADALDFALEAHGLADAALRDELMGLYMTLDAYDDAGPALRALGQAGLAAGILSNGSPDMLEAAVRCAGLSPLLGHVLSVEAAAIFKPSPRAYRLALAATGLERHEVCFVSANGWDAAGAAHFGFQVVWLNRFGQVAERLPGTPMAAVAGLDELPALIE